MTTTVKRPLNKDACRKADDDFYAAHEADRPRPNAAFDANGNRKPLSGSDPNQEALREEWRQYYAKNGGAVEEPATKPEKPPEKPVQPCPIECPDAVEFKAAGKKWGWDDYKPHEAEPWMSVQTGKSDTATAKAKNAAHSGRMCNVTYASSDETIATVSPESGGGDNETLTITGLKKGEVTITASCKGGTKGKFHVAVKDLKELKIMMRRIDHKNYTSTDVPRAALETYLNDMYKPTVTKFTVTELAAKEVDFDADGSDDVDVKGSFPSADLTKIINDAGDSSYDFQVFLVDKPNDGSLGWSGHSNAEKTGIIHPDTSTEPNNTIAHEMGHGLFGLKHSDNDGANSHQDATDKDNLMHSDETGTTMMRKYQWDEVNP